MVIQGIILSIMFIFYAEWRQHFHASNAPHATVITGVVAGLLGWVYNLVAMGAAQ